MFKIFLRRLAAPTLVALGLSLGGCASVPTSGLAAMRDGAATLPPQGWVEFCRRNGTDPSCQSVQLDAARLRQLQQVQASLRAIPRVSDSRTAGQAELWRVADRRGGDCEDIALAARQQLLAAGWPVTALRLATAWTEQREFHVVLTVDAVQGNRPATLVLDSRFAVVMSWQKLEQLGYRFATRQAQHGSAWVTVQS